MEPPREGQSKASSPDESTAGSLSPDGKRGPVNPRGQGQALTEPPIQPGRSHRAPGLVAVVSLQGALRNPL